MTLIQVSDQRETPRKSPFGYGFPCRTDDDTESESYLQIIDFLFIMLTLTPMEKNHEKKKSEHPIVILIIFTLLLIPILIVFGGKSYT